MNISQEKFCVEFVANGGNGTLAYQAVYKSDANTARVNASRLLKKPEVQERLRELQAEQNSEKILSAQELKERLSAIARRETCETIYLPNGKKIETRRNPRNGDVSANQRIVRRKARYGDKKSSGGNSR